LEYEAFDAELKEKLELLYQKGEGTQRIVKLDAFIGKVHFLSNLFTYQKTLNKLPGGEIEKLKIEIKKAWEHLKQEGENTDSKTLDKLSHLSLQIVKIQNEFDRFLSEPTHLSDRLVLPGLWMEAQKVESLRTNQFFRDLTPEEILRVKKADDLEWALKDLTRLDKSWNALNKSEMESPKGQVQELYRKLKEEIDLKWIQIFAVGTGDEERASIAQSKLAQTDLSKEKQLLQDLAEFMKEENGAVSPLSTRLSFEFGSELSSAMNDEIDALDAKARRLKEALFIEKRLSKDSLALKQIAADLRETIRDLSQKLIEGSRIPQKRKEHQEAVNRFHCIGRLGG
jgi:hypothetical protein